jgi:DNA-binding transcriptional regulator YbjK
MTAVLPAGAQRSERRRREVCDAARRVIARQGLEARLSIEPAEEGGAA